MELGLDFGIEQVMVFSRCKPTIKARSTYIKYLSNEVGNYNTLYVCDRKFEDFISILSGEMSDEGIATFRVIYYGSSVVQNEEVDMSMITRYVRENVFNTLAGYTSKYFTKITSA
jgi:hypothetical protein